MFHAAKLERGHQEEIELAERIRDTGVAFEPVERCGVQIEDRVAVAADFLRVCFAMEHPEGAAVAHGLFENERARREREEVRGERSGFGEGEPRAATTRGPRGFLTVRHRLPAGGHVENERPSGFQVRLIETGEGLMRPGWDEDGVEEVVVPVERRIAGVEVE